MFAEKPERTRSEQLDDCIIFDDSDHGDDDGEDEEEDDPIMRRLQQQEEEDIPTNRQQREKESNKENVKPIISQKKTEKQSRGTHSLENFCYFYAIHR